MEIVYYITLTLFFILEIYILYRFAKAKNRLYLKAAAACISLLAAYIVADILFSINVADIIVILVIAAMFIHTYLGYYKDLYNRSKTFDRYLHAYGTFAYALFLHSVIANLTRANVEPKLYSALFVFCIGITVGALFEVVEFFIDRSMHTNTQRGLKDTDLDIIFDFFGAAAAGGVAYFFLL